MNRQHAIDRAEFDTTLALRVDPRQQSALDDFVRTELMRIVDEVFDDIDRKTGAALFRIDRLEIDLGQINLRDYRQQMPQRLRRQLWQALDDARFSHAGSLEQASAGREQPGGSAALLHYLRHGYLPRDAAVTDAAALEELLARAIETDAGPLIEAIAGSARRDSIIARLEAQFAPALVERIKRLLTAARGAAEDITARQAGSTDAVGQIKRLEAALAENRRAALQRWWQDLARRDRATLAEVLRAAGRRADARRQLARLLSAEQFAGLVRTIEPDAHAEILALLLQPDWMPLAASRVEIETRIREYLLGYLLVERGRRFDRVGFIDSLLHQVEADAAGAGADSRRRLRENLTPAAARDDLSAELARLMLARLEGDAAAGAEDADVVAAYRRYARVAALFGGASAVSGAADAVDDVDHLMRQAPWLMLRLVRELQSAGDGWRAALPGLDARLLQRLVDAVLTLFARIVSDTPSAGSAELAAAVASHARRAPDRRLYYARVFSRLVAGDALDLEGPSDAETDYETEVGGVREFLREDDPDARDRVLQRVARLGRGRAQRMLQSAELLISAGLAAGLGLPPPRLQQVKWRQLQARLEQDSGLFDLPAFVRQMLDSLLAEAGLTQSGSDARRDFYSRLAQALLQNSLPASRDLTRQLVELLHEDAAELAATAAEEVAPAATAAAGDVTPDEDIHIDNAGLVLLAPWLPRLFERMGLLQHGEFRDRAAAERAVHCAQFLVDGSVDSPEYRLVLNKLLCGVAPGRPIRRSIELSNAETAQLEELLEAVKQHWKALQNTSIEGLRESFLQRGGRLQRRQDAWQLDVEARAFDLLLDQVPWSYSTIKFAWMERVIYVDWR